LFPCCIVTTHSSEGHDLSIGASKTSGLRVTGGQTLSQL